MSGGLTIASVSVPLEKRPALIGLIIGRDGSVFGPVLGGLITQYSTWRWAFYMNMPIGGLALLFLSWFKIPDQVAKPKPLEVLRKIHTYLDLVGFVLSAAAAVLFLTALELGGNTYTYASPVVIGTFVGSAAALVAFLAWNSHMGESGLIPPSVAGKTPVMYAVTTNFTMIGSAMIQIYLLPVYFQTVAGASPAQSGVNVLPSILTQLAFAYGGGLLVGNLGYYLPWAVGGTAVTIIASGLFTMLTPTTPVAQWVIYQIIAGAGRGVVLQLPSIAVQANLPPEEISVGISFVTFSQFMGGAISLGAGNAIFVGTLKRRLSHYLSEADVAAVLSAGATGFRHTVPGNNIPGVVAAYVSAITHELYLSLALATASFCLSWGMGWKDIRPKVQLQENRKA
ncbi:efflux pump [Colletotrichum caudatum]|nr:efflux pump [Colletotrichum caudatum]